MTKDKNENLLVADNKNILNALILYFLILDLDYYKFK